MNTEIVSQAARATIDGSIPFPEVVRRLIETGVKYYHVDYVALRKHYYSAIGDVVLALLRVAVVDIDRLRPEVFLEIDHATWTLTRRMATGRGIYNLAVTPDGKLMVGTLKQSAGFEIFDLASGKSVARLKTTNTVAHGVAISTDSRYAFVSSEGVGAAPGKVDVFDLQARAKVATFSIGQQASGIAFWKMVGRKQAPLKK